MPPWLLLAFLLTSISTSLSLPPEVADPIPSGAPSNPSITDPQTSKLPWLTCNAPPRYTLPLTRSHCQSVYDRLSNAPRSYRKQGWHGINTPETLTEESDDCVIRLETNFRQQSDTFSSALMAHVGLRVAMQCVLGGAASLGREGFYISVTGMVPANMVGNGTTANTTAEVATA